MFGLGPMEMLIVGIIAVLLFGKRLPEVGRSFGKSIMEFKKGMRDVETDLHSTTTTSDRAPASVTHQRTDLDDHDEPTAPKFEPPAREPYSPPTRDPGNQTAHA